MSDEPRTPTEILKNLRRHKITRDEVEVFAEEPPPSSSPTTSLALIKKRVIQQEEETPPHSLFLHIALDKSGSFAQHEKTLNAFVFELVQEIVRDGLDGFVQVAYTEMAGVASSRPYCEPFFFKPLGFNAGGGSPHAAFLREARLVDAPLIGSGRGNIIRVIICDGNHTDSYDDVRNEVVLLRGMQERDPAFQVFTVWMGDTVNNNLLKQFSINRPEFDCVGYDFEALRGEIRALINATAEDPTVPARTMNLKDIPKPFMERSCDE